MSLRLLYERPVCLLSVVRLEEKMSLKMPSIGQYGLALSSFVPFKSILPWLLSLKTLYDSCSEAILLLLKSGSSPLDSLSTGTMAPPEFKITTCLRSDAILLKSEPNKQYAVSVGKANKFYMLRLHVQRMVTAAEVFKWPEAQKLGRLELIRALGNHLKSKYGDSYMKDPLKVSYNLVKGIQGLWLTQS